MEQLIKDIKTANRAYAKGIPILTDSEYDILWRKLYNINPKHPMLYHTSNDPSSDGSYIIHLCPIMGTQKAFDMEDMKPFLQRFGAKSLILEPKYDGIAAMIYNEPEGYRLILHGDGLKGKDKSIHLNNISYPIFKGPKMSVELLIPNDAWDESYGKNPRNTTAGWINRNEPDYPDGVITAISHEKGALFTYINPPYRIDDLEELFLSYYSLWAKTFPMDGIMIKLSDEKDRLISAHNGTVSLWSIAWKPPISVKPTTVVDLHWNVSRLGRIIPTIEYEPIILCGSTNRMVTGNNAAWLKEKGIDKGAEIIIGKAGEIIPKVIEVRKPVNVELPTKCPECQALLEPLIGVHLICEGDSCIMKQVASLDYFYSAAGMEIKSLGSMAMYDLLQDDDLKEALAVSPWLLINPGEYFQTKIRLILGEKKYFTYNSNRLKLYNNVNPAHFIAALGYEGLAYKNALKCYQQLRGIKIRGSLNKVTIENFINALAMFQKAKADLQDFTFKEIPRTSDVLYCITGELSMSRSDMITWLSQANWQYSSGVTKDLDFLLLGYVSNETKKLKKAMAYNITVIKEHDIPSLINNNKEP